MRVSRAKCGRLGAAPSSGASRHLLPEGEAEEHQSSAGVGSRGSPAAPSGAQEKTVAADTTPEPILPVAPAANSDSQEINKAILMNLAAVRQSVDRLAIRQQQMSNEIATLKMAEQNILRKISSAPPAQAAAAPARKPASRSPQDPTPLQ